MRFINLILSNFIGQLTTSMVEIYIYIYIYIYTYIIIYIKCIYICPYSMYMFDYE